MTARILYVAPANADEARTAAQAARAHNLTHLWVDVPDDETAGKTLLTAAVQAGRAQGLMVFGVVRLLRRPLSFASTASDEEDAAPTAATLPGSDDDLLDRTIQGETGAAWGRRRLRSADAQEPWMRATLSRAVGDWLRPDAPATFERMKNRLLDLSATPGLTGLVLTGTAAPGYGDPGEANRGGWTPGDERDFGYTPANRLAFLRQEGLDPVDLITFPAHSGNADLNLPFFSDNAFQPRYVEVNGQWMPEPGVLTPVQKWAAFRYQQNIALLSRLHETLRAASPSLALVLRSRPESIGGENWFGTWDKSAAPSTSTGFDYSPSGAVKFAQTARTFSQRILLSVPPLLRLPQPDPRMDDQKRYAWTLGHLMERHKTANWDGIVFDLSSVASDRPLAKTLSVLSVLDSALDSADPKPDARP